MSTWTADELRRIDAASELQYDCYGPGPVAAITGPDVLETTLRVTPRN